MRRILASGPLRSVIRLVGRERAHGGVNGDRYTFVGHRDDGRLRLRRERDGVAVLWDLHEHRAIDHGYATTSYRSQGRTVDAVFALASSADARRGLYVGVTRAREDVTIAYGKDDVRDFGDLFVRAQRDNGKMLVRDVAQQLAIVREQARAAQRKEEPEQNLGHGINRGSSGIGR